MFPGPDTTFLPAVVLLQIRRFVPGATITINILLPPKQNPQGRRLFQSAVITVFSTTIHNVFACKDKAKKRRKKNNLGHPQPKNKGMSSLPHIFLCENFSPLVCLTLLTQIVARAAGQKVEWSQAKAQCNAHCLSFLFTKTCSRKREKSSSTNNKKTPGKPVDDGSFKESLRLKQKKEMKSQKASR